MATTTTIISTDREALQVLYACLGGAQWTRADKWLSDAPISEWCGVQTTNDGEGEPRVSVLELSRNNLAGDISAPAMTRVFERLSSTLDQLWLSENPALTGTPPSVLALACPNLKTIDVGSCGLRGAVHPAFASKHFNWFDTSGNQLTSYFRFAREDDGKESDDAAAPPTTTTTTATTTITIGGAPTAAAASSSSSYPALWQVHTVEGMLTAALGGRLIFLAEHWASDNGGWMTSRHRAYKTTDIDIAVCGGELLEMCDGILKTSVLPRMANMFRFAPSELAVEDLFLAKYSAAKGAQRALGEHRDGSELSFVITLNDPARDFSGGGTRFVAAPGAEDVVVEPTVPGTAVFFSGQHRHSGIAVTEGTRYIIAGFVRVFPVSDESTARLECLQEIRDEAAAGEGATKKRRRLL